MTGCQILRFEQVYGLASNDTYSDVFTHITMLANRSWCTPHKPFFSLRFNLSTYLGEKITATEIQHSPLRILLVYFPILLANREVRKVALA